ncbi:thrombospondin type 3 repeat-containing protein [Spongiibacter sp. KMU-158]|uniref:Thrombospondin type 3 repeat-containing protein n=1 Tax=Spongiibacter pelagi TaxID=2760804 RepID=A0A927C3D2_9GAMM|nr:thrombospondin type 3 repeat-containing protein [Spongiibacter pelagi]MBD2858881.1 thrombospondin type 3 repeat-containing protein [Spongiibacter pelagi]
MKRILLNVPMVFLSCVLVACGGGGGGDKPSPTDNTLKTGLLLDNHLIGVPYRRANSSEVLYTNAQGEFEYLEGETIRFFFAGKEIGRAQGQPFVTLKTLAANTTGLTNSQKDAFEINLARLLLSLDADQNPDNGITLTPALIAEAESKAGELNFTASELAGSNFETLPISEFVIDKREEQGGSRVLVSAETAAAHIDAVQKDISDEHYDNDGGVDSDADGVNDAVDECPDQKGVAQFNGCSDQAAQEADDDADGIPNNADNCPAVSNSDQNDLDGDKRGDACDSDADGDGLSKTQESEIGTSDLESDSDEDGVDDSADAFPLDASRSKDSDGDGIDDDNDLCPLKDTGEPEEEQADSDGDGIGDACDTLDPSDLDGDGKANSVDNCPNNANSDQADSNGNGLGDACDDSDIATYFESDVDSNLAVCRACHQPSGQADVPEGRGFMLDSDGIHDLKNTHFAWFGLGRGVSNNDILTQAANTYGDHTGGKLWATDSAPYIAMQKVLVCWEDMNHCELADSDDDGVTNNLDHCRNTTDTTGLDANGCSDDDRAEPDDDGDGVANSQDDCSATPSGSTVDHNGCALSQRDADGDGIYDDVDQCPNTVDQAGLNAQGCSTDDLAAPDDDGDGVANSDDDCESTPANETADSNGCSLSQLDSDADGVSDLDDTCDNTPADEDPDDVGCSASQRDGDNDGISDAQDFCPATTDQVGLDSQGCSDADRANPDDPDRDGVFNDLDICPGTTVIDIALIDAQGCSAEQRSAGENQLFNFYESGVHTALNDCRLCHVQNGVADKDEGKSLQFTSSSTDASYLKLYDDWVDMGKGVSDSSILSMASDPETSHTGGKQLPLGSVGQVNVTKLLICWDDRESCDVEGVVPDEKLPLLGSSRGGHIWFDTCFVEGTTEYLDGVGANTELPEDPRTMIKPGVNQGIWDETGDEKAAYFNAFWKNCHIDEDGDGTPEELQATSEGIITEKAHPKTCGQLKLSIERGKVVMGVTPLPAPGDPRMDCSDPDNVLHSPFCNTLGELIRPGSTFSAYEHDSAGAIAADAYNLLYKVWDPAAQTPPENFDRIAAERYGMGWDENYDNPYPLKGEDPNDPSTFVETMDKNGELTKRLTKGGSGQLPVGLIQLRDENGNYSGNIGINCQACHGITIGTEFVWGGGGAMLDLATFGADLEAVNAYYAQYMTGFDPETDRPVGVGFGLDRVGVSGRVRGTNNAQFSNVTSAVGAIYSENAEFKSLLLTEEDPSGVIDVLTSGSTATGDTPAWWNVGRRPVKFVDAMTSGDAVRVDMALFFPLFAFTPPAPSSCMPNSPDYNPMGCMLAGGAYFGELTGFDTSACENPAIASDSEAQAECFLSGWKQFSEQTGFAYYPSEPCEAYLYGGPFDFDDWMSCGFQQNPANMTETDWYNFLTGASTIGQGEGGDSEEPDSESTSSSQSSFEFAVRWVGENAQYADHWLMTLKSPEYPFDINFGLAEAGAILFHSKDLREALLNESAEAGTWQEQAVAAWDEMESKGYTGNGSCASCHGVYSPRYVNDPDYLDDKSMEGIASYVVPINAIGTDRVRFDTYMASTYDYLSAMNSGEIGGDSEGSYNSGVNKGNSEEYIFYAETAGLDESTDQNGNFNSGDCRAQNLDGQQTDHRGENRALGYAAPPLYGVWATGPYFHNGSVPSVEGVLNSEVRPPVWRRNSKTNDLGSNFVMGFDSGLDAFDETVMGWMYEEIDCLGSNALECSLLETALSTAEPVVKEFYDSILLSWNVTNPPVLTKQDIEARKIYNTGMHSQSNAGHTFTNVLTDTERKAIIEYLKTL